MAKDKKAVDKHFAKKQAEEAKAVAETEKRINKLNKEEADANERLRRMIEDE